MESINLIQWEESVINSQMEKFGYIVSGTVIGRYNGLTIKACESNLSLDLKLCDSQPYSIICSLTNNNKINKSNFAKYYKGGKQHLPVCPMNKHEEKLREEPARILTPINDTKWIKIKNSPIWDNQILPEITLLKEFNRFQMFMERELNYEVCGKKVVISGRKPHIEIEGVFGIAVEFPGCGKEFRTAIERPWMKCCETGETYLVGLYESSDTYYFFINECNEEVVSMIEYGKNGNYQWCYKGSKLKVSYLKHHFGTEDSFGDCECSSQNDFNGELIAILLSLIPSFEKGYSIQEVHPKWFDN